MVYYISDESGHSQTSDSLSPHSEHLSTRSTSPSDIGADIIELGQATQGSKGLFSCRCCHKKFFKKRYLTKHVRCMHPGSLITNKIKPVKVRCLKSGFTDDNSMSCPQCNKTLYKDNYYQHLSVCSRSDTYTYTKTGCTIVNNTSQTYSESKSTSLTSTVDIGTIACQFCGEVIKQFDLTHHLAEQHSIPNVSRASFARNSTLLSSGSESVSSDSEPHALRIMESKEQYNRKTNSKCDQYIVPVHSDRPMRRSKQYIVPKTSIKPSSPISGKYVIPHLSSQPSSNKNRVDSMKRSCTHIPPRLNNEISRQLTCSDKDDGQLSVMSTPNPNVDSKNSKTIKPTISYYTKHPRVFSEDGASSRHEGLDSNVRDKMLLQSC